MAIITRYWKFSLFFLLVIIANILSLTVIPEFHKVTKVFIMVALMGFYIFQEEDQSQVFIIGMIAALMGDIFLMFDNADFFLIGMLAFLVMQLCYAFVFNKDRRVITLRDMVVPAIMLVISGVILSRIWQDLGGMKVPIVFYFLAILAMGILAYLRKSSVQGYIWVFLGAVLFIISDAVLAIDKFSDFGLGHTATRITIMLTYMLAQYFIVLGIVDGKRKNALAPESSYASKLSDSTMARLQQKKSRK